MNGRRSPVLSLEALEDRCVLSASPQQVLVDVQQPNSPTQVQVVGQPASGQTQVQVTSPQASSSTQVQVVSQPASGQTQVQVTNPQASTPTQVQVVSQPTSGQTQAQVTNQQASSSTQVQVVSQAASGQTQVQVTNQQASSPTQVQVVSQPASGQTQVQVTNDQANTQTSVEVEVHQADGQVQVQVDVHQPTDHPRIQVDVQQASRQTQVQVDVRHADIHMLVRLVIITETVETVLSAEDVQAAAILAAQNQEREAVIPWAASGALAQQAGTDESTSYQLPLTDQAIPSATLPSWGVRALGSLLGGALPGNLLSASWLGQMVLAQPDWLAADVPPAPLVDLFGSGPVPGEGRLDETAWPATLAEFTPETSTALAVDLDQVLDRVSDLGSELGESLSGGALRSWLIAVAAAGAAYAGLRRLRRRRGVQIAGQGVAEDATTATDTWLKECACGEL
jgi:hypothetical protein